jgi:hypothetical protein
MGWMKPFDFMIAYYESIAEGERKAAAVRSATPVAMPSQPAPATQSPAAPQAVKATLSLVGERDDHRTPGSSCHFDLFELLPDTFTCDDMLPKHVARVADILRCRFAWNTQQLDSWPA